MKITNTSNTVQNFVLNGKAKDGVPPTGHVDPNKTEDLDVNMDAEGARLNALVASHQVTVSGRDASKVEAAADTAKNK
jgi:hypothetical protein